MGRCLVLQHPDFVARRDDFLVGQAVPPVTAGSNRRFGCGKSRLVGQPAAD
jgi:hypothetical protein